MALLTIFGITLFVMVLLSGVALGPTPAPTPTCSVIPVKPARAIGRAGTVILAMMLVVVDAPPVAAQTTTGRSALSVSPAIVEDTTDAGKTFTTQLTVGNVTDQSIAIHASAKELVPEQAVDPAYKAAYDASPWFSIDNSDFFLTPQQQKTVNVTISIPKDAEPGGHYATVYFESFLPEPQGGGTTTLISARVGVLMLLTVKGDIREHTSISGPISVQGVQLEAGPTAFSTSIKNDGNVHLLPFGSLTVRNIFGQKVKTVPLPLGIVLPGTTREYDMSWEHGLKVGLYTADETITVGTQQVKLHPKSARFLLLPLVVVVPAVLLLLLFLGVLSLVLRARRRRRSRVSGPSLPAPSTDDAAPAPDDGSSVAAAEDAGPEDAGEEN